MKARSSFLKKSLFMLVCLLMLTPNISFAAESKSNKNKELKQNITSINNEFENIFNESNSIEVSAITSDEEAYSVLLDNKEYVTINSDKTISVDVESIVLNRSLSDSDVSFLIDFVNRINHLISVQAIAIDEKLIISFVEVSPQPTMRPMAQTISIMGTTRSHARTLKSVFDNAVFSTRHIVAGAYFAERVKPGGVWDYKVSLGLNTGYYVSDLGNALMTGESIGNFHYGYVGRAVFSATTLKSAAGMVQIYAGTSSTSYWDSFFDDPRDQAQIQKGIDKYNAEH